MFFGACSSFSMSSSRMRRSPRILGFAGFGGDVGDERLLLLAVPVDAAVALLEDHQRPGNVEVDQLVRRGSAG